MPLRTAPGTGSAAGPNLQRAQAAELSSLPAPARGAAQSPPAGEGMWGLGIAGEGTEHRPSLARALTLPAGSSRSGVDVAGGVGCIPGAGWLGASRSSSGLSRIYASGRNGSLMLH